ncbi:hypothetical protein N7470_005203, partial [Penicillium chermesinum]
MNWTGGQLHLHSSRSGVLSKTQRQNFASTRQLAGSKPSPPRPFSGFSSLKESDAKRDDEAQQQSVTELGVCSQSTEQSDARPAEGPSLESGNQLDQIKQKLLRRSDWAVLSATRPLAISFPPQTERFGKRRKLTGADHKRLTATNGEHTLPMLFQSYRRGSGLSAGHYLPDVQIRINGQLTNHPSSQLINPLDDGPRTSLSPFGP